jgi:ATP-dependent Clp protease ATP-binding subunit ClpA
MMTTSSRPATRWRNAGLPTASRRLEREAGTLDVTVDDIAQVIEAWTGIPVQRITEGEAQKDC